MIDLYELLIDVHKALAKSNLPADEYSKLSTRLIEKKIEIATKIGLIDKKWNK